MTLYSELMRTIEAVRSKQQEYRKMIDELKNMTHQDSIYVEFNGFDFNMRGRVYVLDAIIKEVEFKLEELGRVEVDLLKGLEAVSKLEL